MRWMSIALVSACTTSPGIDAPPHLQVEVANGTLAILYQRGQDHVFDRSLAATVNGIDSGAPSIEPGGDATYNMPAWDAKATWVVPVSQVGSDVHIVVVEGSAQYVFDASSIATPRQVVIVSALDQPLHPGDWIEIASSVTGDSLFGGFAIAEASVTCTQDSAMRDDGTSLGLQLRSDLATYWPCGVHEATPGAIVHATMSIALQPTAPPTTCMGPDLTCAGVWLPWAEVETPVSIQF